MKRLCQWAALLFFTTAFCALPLVAAPQASLIEQARTEAAAGHLDRAIQLFHEVLESAPDNPDALSGLIDALVSAGRWRDALPSLQHLVQLQPNDAGRTFQLGQMDSWLGNQRGAALPLLQRAVNLDPGNVSYAMYYAQVLSWRDTDRPQALSVLRDLLAAQPADVNVLLAYAEILSWNRSTRPQALECYKKVLVLDSGNAAALDGEAQLLA